MRVPAERSDTKSAEQSGKTRSQDRKPAKGGLGAEAQLTIQRLAAPSPPQDPAQSAAMFERAFRPATGMPDRPKLGVEQPSGSAMAPAPLQRKAMVQPSAAYQASESEGPPRDSIQRAFGRPGGKAMAPVVYAPAASNQPPYSAAPIQRAADSGARATASPSTSGKQGALPNSLKSGIESLSGISMEHVKVHYNSARPAQLGALAYTQGSTIHVGPGQERHLAHEAWHVVQQAQGRVKPTMQMKSGLPVNDDQGLEREADEMGSQAQAMVAASAPAAKELHQPGSASSSDAPAQMKMGFELEMLVLIDANGRPVPEKTDVGDYGPHIQLDVDQGPSVEAITPALPETADFDVQGDHQGSYAIGAHTFATLAAAKASNDFWTAADPQIMTFVAGYMAHVHAAQMGDENFDTFANRDDNGDIARLVQTAVVGLQGQPQYRRDIHGKRALANPSSMQSIRAVTDEFIRLAQLPANDALGNIVVQMCLKTSFVDTNTNDEVDARTATDEPGMGGTRYASILELVTNAYEPETDAGRQDIIASVQAAKDLADAIEAANPRQNRFRFNTLAGAGGIDASYYLGNPRQKAQTTDASIQCTFALDLAHLASFIKSTMGPGATSLFHSKHSDDVPTQGGYRYLSEGQLNRAIDDATEIIKSYPAGTDLPNVRGFLIMVSQYLRLGKFSWSPGEIMGGGSWNLDKNLTAMLSRTNLALIRQGMPLAERTWLDTNVATLKAKLLAKTGRLADSCLLTDPTQDKERDGWPTVDTFLDNVLTTGNDGITGFRGNRDEDQPLFGGFRRMPAEEIHPDDSALEAQKKVGPVYELRNLVPFLRNQERFPRTQWVPLARQLMTVLEKLHDRDDDQAMNDVKVKTGADGAHTETDEALNRWDT